MDAAPTDAVAAILAIRAPDVLNLAALARVLGLATSSGARRALLSGRLGIPYVRDGRRYLVRRTALMDALAAREVRPPEVLGAASR
ncbi:MAG: hypothetical protein K8T20_17185 [Planctomycetes bacterium]|nr:hypothetical protein [Planctomycetota bacterium]